MANHCEPLAYPQKSADESKNPRQNTWSAPGKAVFFFLGGGAVVHHPSKTRTAWIINSKTCKILAFKISFPAKGFDAATHLLKLGVLKGPLKKHQPFFSCLQQDSKTRNFWILRPSRPQRFGLEVCGMRWENDWLPGDSSRDLLIP